MRGPWKEAWWQGSVSQNGIITPLGIVGIWIPCTCLDVRVDPGPAAFTMTLTFKFWAQYQDQRVDKTGFFNNGSGSFAATVTQAGGVQRFTYLGSATLGWQIEMTANAAGTVDATGVVVAAIAHGRQP